MDGGADMAELPWLAAGLYVPLLFYRSQDGFSGLCTVVSRKVWAAVASPSERSRHPVLSAECRLKLVHAVKGGWPPIKIAATCGLVDVGEKDLPESGRFLAKTLQPSELVGVRELIDARQV
jgi:hypothetical protein